MQRVRCMLSHAKLLKIFWVEAMRTDVCLTNLSPSTSLNGDVPKKVWLGKDVSYDHLKVFGYRIFVHIPKDERSKLDSKSKQCIFQGYGNEEFGYRLWDPVEEKLVRSRDIVFLEDKPLKMLRRMKSQSLSMSFPLTLTQSLLQYHIMMREMSKKMMVNLFRMLLK